MNAPARRSRSEAEDALRFAARDVASVPPDQRIYALEDAAKMLGAYVAEGSLDPTDASDKILEIADAHGLSGPPGSEAEGIIYGFALLACRPDRARSGVTSVTREHADLGFEESQVDTTLASQAASPFTTITPASWKGTEPTKQRWLATARIPSGDLTIVAGNGGSGKTEIVTGLLVSVAGDLGDWLGCVVETGTVLFLSCEEPEGDIRDRVERICKHRHIDPHAIDNLHLQFPDLENAWLATTDRFGRIVKTALFEQMEAWIKDHRPVLVAVDSIAAVFDAVAWDRRQVRSFLAMLRKVARQYDTAIVLLDHPSVRGMADGTGTANSVDWRNSVRSMLHLSDPDKQDPDARDLEVKKSNRGRVGEKTKLRWNGLTFVTEATAAASPYRAAAERDIDELFLRLLERRNAQGRWVTPNKAAGYAPKELAAMPGAEGTTATALANAMERLIDAGRVINETFGPPSKQRQRLIVSLPTTLPTETLR
jgi:RecA-family ATPase